MSAQWIPQIIGKMHTNRIKQVELARRMGLTPEYVCMVFSGRRNPIGAKEKFNAALDELIREKEETPSF